MSVIIPKRFSLRTRIASGLRQEIAVLLFQKEKLTLARLLGTGRNEPHCVPHYRESADSTPLRRRRI